MPRKSGKKQAWMSDFVEYSLTKKNEEELHERARTVADVFAIVEQLIDDGLKVSLRRDPSGKGFSCWLQPLDNDSPNAKLILTAHAGGIANAIVKAAFVHYNVLRGEWPDAKTDEVIEFWDSVK